MEYTFENYCDKESYAYKAALMFTERPMEKDDSFNPLYIYGDNERKREHLTNAIANALTKNPSYSIVDLDAGLFTNALISAIRTGINMDQFIRRYSTDLLIIRRLHLFVNLETASWELFRLVDYVKNELGGKIVFTTYASPVELVEMGFYERYTSRATAGIVCNVDSSTAIADSTNTMSLTPRYKKRQKGNWNNNKTHSSPKKWSKRCTRRTVYNFVHNSI